MTIHPDFCPVPKSEAAAAHVALRQVLALDPAARVQAEMALKVRARAGDQRAFGVLIALHRPRLLRLAGRYLPSRHDAEDAVQQVCIAALNAVGSFRGEASFLTWMVRITARAALLAQRMNARRREVEACWNAHDGMAAPEQYLAARQTAGIVLHAMGRMPAVVRDALWLCEMDGVPYARIAALQDCPVGTVRSRIARGRSIVAEQLAAVR